MIYIAHRGLIHGPDEDLENEPENIIKTLNKGFHAEIDVRYTDGSWYLGHDKEQYEVDNKFLSHPNLWIHCKNLGALLHIPTITPLVKYFWHQEDDFTLTSNGYIWTYPGKQLTNRSICVLPERQFPRLSDFQAECYGVCSKYVNLMK